MKRNLKLMNNRIKLIEVIMFGMFLILGIFLVRTLLLKGNFYKEKLNELTNVLVYGDSAPRGRIYDRNYNLLVDNVSVPVIYYKKNDDITVKEEIELAYSIIDKIDLNYEKLNLRNLKEFYLALYPDECSSKIKEEEWEKLKQRILTNTDIENLKITRITDEDLNVFTEKDKKTAYL